MRSILRILAVSAAMTCVAPAAWPSLLPPDTLQLPSFSHAYSMAQSDGTGQLPSAGAQGNQPDGEGEDLTLPDPSQEGADVEGGASPDDLSLGEIPVIETIELTPDIAKRAIDAYILVKEKYKDAELELYENLQDFVDQNPVGKQFEGDLKTGGFADVNDWNTAITTLSFAYSGVIDDQSADIRQQIEEITQDTQLAQDMKDRMIASLNAMIPSENNRKVALDLLADPEYGDKLKLLNTEEE